MTSPSRSPSFRSGLVRGEVLHARADAYAHRRFRYPVYAAVLDLAELPALDRDLRLFSHERANLFSLRARDYDTLDPRALADLRAGAGLPPAATTLLVTNPRVLGYTFNPVSFFLGYDAAGALTSAIAEVNNTYGGRLRYLLRDPEPGPRGVKFTHVRELFVSPFLHGPATYDFWFDVPRDGSALAIDSPGSAGARSAAEGRRGVSIDMHVRQAGHRTFTARLAGTRAPLTDRALAAAALRYPAMTAQVIGLIHWQALKLRRLGVPYRAAPPDHRPLAAYPPR